MKSFALFFWFLAVTADMASVYLNYRPIEVFALTFFAGSFIFSRKAIHKVWVKKLTWWQVNEDIEFTMLFQSTFTVTALLIVVGIIYEWPKLEKSGMDRMFMFTEHGLFLSLSFFAWLLGRRARIDAEQGQIPAEPPPPKPHDLRSFRDEVLREVDGGLWLAK